MNIVKINGTECTLRFGQYSNDTIAIEAIEVDTGDVFAVCTVNWEANWRGATEYRKTFSFPSVVIKDYSENDGVYQSLRLGGVVTQGAYMDGTGGMVRAATLTPEWEEIAKQQLGLK